MITEPNLPSPATCGRLFGTQSAAKLKTVIGDGFLQQLAVGVDLGNPAEAVQGVLDPPEKIGVDARPDE